MALLRGDDTDEAYTGARLLADALTNLRVLAFGQVRKR